MTPRTLLAFGGPWNERLVTIDRHPPVYAAVPEPFTTIGLDPPTATAFREVRYDLEWVGGHDPDRCDTRFPDDGVHSPRHGDHCYWTAGCLVAEGYPKHRITDTLKFLVALTQVWHMSTPASVR